MRFDALNPEAVSTGLWHPRGSTAVPVYTHVLQLLAHRGAAKELVIQDGPLGLGHTCLFGFKV